MCDSLYNYYGIVYKMYFFYIFVFVDLSLILLFRVLMKYLNYNIEYILK